ncbi:MAG TPA: MFS transporter [Myxococcota bacterium]|nr:MFS transporter [Myxococcota bacterium]
MRDRYELPPSVPARAGTFAALGTRDFRVLWSGTWASYIPFFMSNVVNGVVAFQLTHVNRGFGAVMLGQGLAMAVLAPFGGAGADRWPKRRLLAASQTCGAAVFGSFAVLLALHSLTILAMALGVFVLGVAVSFLGPARQALAAELVVPELRGNAVALNQIPLTGSQLLGPAIAGLLLNSPFGAVGAYALMSALYAIAALSLFWLPKSLVRANAGDSHLFADLVEGLEYVWAHRRLRLLVSFFVCVIVAGFSYVTMLAGLVEHAFERGAQAGVPPLTFTSALGGLVISLITARMAGGVRVLPLFLTMPFVFAAGLLCLGAAPSYSAAVAAMLLVGIGFGGFQTLNSAVIVQNTEPAYFGRVFSLSMLAFAGVSLMGLPVAAFADAVGERTTLAVLSAAVVAISLGIGAMLRRTHS